MGEEAKFWIFTDAYCFVGFFTQIFYILTPIALMFQLKSGVIKYERVSIFALLSLYCNAFIYFFTSLYKIKKDADINPLDFCNLAGAYLGLVYLIMYIFFVHLKTNKIKGMMYIVILVISSIVVWLIIKYTVEEGNVADKIFNWLGVIFNVTEYFPMGFDIIYLLKKKISEKYTIFGAFFGFLNCVAWLTWAIHAVVCDGSNLVHSIAANSLGICLQITQFVLFFKFKRDDIDSESVGEKPCEIDEDGDDIGKKNEQLEENKENEFLNEFI